MSSTSNKKPYIPKEWETAACPFCGSNKFTVYERFGSDFQYTYVLCNDCDLVYTSPRPKYDKDFIDAAYASYYQYADSLKVEDLVNIRESSLKMFGEEVAHLGKYDKKKTAVLDIGSGMGTFLYAAKPFYKSAVGLDVSEQMAAFVEKQLGLKVYIGQYDQFDPGFRFSLIHMSHVLEHVPNPNEWIQHSVKMLEPGGILVINVPHKFGIGNRIQHLFYKLGLKKQISSSWSDPSRTPDHLFEPTIKSMQFLLKKNNFEILEYYTYSRKDPVSNKNFISRMMNRWLKLGSNLTFITRPIK